MSEVTCAVLGFGRLGQWHAENLAKLKQANVMSICDPNVDKMQQKAKELGIPHYTTNPDDIFQDDRIQAVIISTPTSTHYELLKKAIKYGKAIFIEKPLTRTLEEAEEIVQLIEQKSIFCQVGFMRRFDPAYVEAKKRILAGDIGEPVFYKGVSRDPGAPPIQFVKNSGGIFLDLAIHDYDMARFLLNSEVTKVSAHGNVLIHDFMHEFNDVDQAGTYLTFSNGASADIESSRNAFYGYDIRGEIIGTEGSISIGSLRYHDVKVFTNKGASYDLLPSFPERFKDAYIEEMTQFVTSLAEGSPSLVTADDAKKSLEIAYAATSSFRQSQVVSLSRNQVCL
ncbi:inositol 2-dehydrogenase [Alkalihalobacillus sp. MEB130]|uniref:inositol 2-dehydrogenase n=1 Tax=Alkalihalobacillus sp. MEB130 TaxID=2976704 RepID=UPI0028E09EEF|nr:inositol 2-dehydrogenase [Alkalihalobacillus sp. MEB130]MDT8860134.1 inositol 2-dehydrogenase [Alkalihalobacillus sp. MEB130]